MPEGLIESELFGHKKGAFTDARADKPGLFVEADGGTIFLDEIGELALPLQAKLLRVLQEHEVRPLGATKNQRVDVRVVAATNKNLEAMLADGSFREDLYYRLNVIHLDLPPLRSRPEDIVPLAEHVLGQLGAQPDAAAPDAAVARGAAPAARVSLARQRPRADERARARRRAVPGRADRRRRPAAARAREARRPTSSAPRSRAG